MISDFNRERHAEWLHSTGYEEKDAPYEWCVDAINLYPGSVIPQSIMRFMEAWRYGYAAGLKENKEILMDCREAIGNIGRFPELFDRLDSEIHRNEPQT